MLLLWFNTSVPHHTPSQVALLGEAGLPIYPAWLVRTFRFALFAPAIVAVYLLGFSSSEAAGDAT